ncbi:MAG: glycosyltransferase [Clostridia bacterium]|nr:glycosyltransferase [Clostridia bacterium]MBQ7289146.1 glycosyltransferase [Clostridia bacterium]
MTIGVAIALYNGAKFIKLQLDSIRLQSVAPDKVILCDDGSNDETIEIVKDYIKTFGLEDKWQLVINEQNLGYARNFYKAMHLCDTDLIFLCDQDDIWELDKIQKMAGVMKNRSDILVLASKFGMIDADGNVMHGLLEKRARQTEEVRSITHIDLLRAFYWPGMIMAVRRDFFEGIYDLVKDHTVAHDRVLSHFAAEKAGFYEYDYIGAYHRRHGNNTANEEHRVWKLLNLKRKLRDMADHNAMLQGLLDIPLPFAKDTVNLIEENLRLSEMREKAVKNRDLKLLRETYKNRQLMRVTSYICDIWLICFGK